MGRYFLEAMPMAGVYLCIVLLIFAACEAGILIGRHHQRTRQDEGAQTSVGPIVGGLLGMLAFLLAFTFSTASTHYGARKQDVLTEAIHIGTAYRRADLLGDARGPQVKRLLDEYVDVRLRAARPGGDLKAGVARSLEIQDLIWAQVLSAVHEDPDRFTSLVVASVNDVIAVHERRVADGVHARIPGRIWVGLLAITMLTMGTLGLQIGLSGKRRLVGIIPITLTFAVLVTLIVDLNRPQGGFITVSPQPLIELQDRLRSEN
ncbi:bestrophin-like domain [Marilutibacter alkalisoli]|uniref:DUF4239 domain-containing protein n=1 Tax=Marilutibacter alkalisoli TaxID=2591633 RepID=A0A514BST3_9GAMM|nr:hypothetical protein [Lysobacter alkalisoli]QDH70436.1 hypothetical protein FKV23_10345 [Lysobacter alkalisoli]